MNAANYTAIFVRFLFHFLSHSFTQYIVLWYIWSCTSTIQIWKRYRYIRNSSKNISVRNKYVHVFAHTFMVSNFIQIQSRLLCVNISDPRGEYIIDVNRKNPYLISPEQHASPNRMVFMQYDLQAAWKGGLHVRYYDHNPDRLHLTCIMS